MFSKPNRWIFALLATLFVAVWALRPAQVSAAQIATPATNSCLTCHEDLYYLHDTGKWYCITEHKDRCVNCHEGNAAVMNKDESHQGFIAHPQRNNGEKCQECHAKDSQTRLAKFSTLGGYKTLHETKPYIPSSSEVTTIPGVPEANPLAENWPWLAGGFLAFGLWLTLVLFSPLKP